MFNSLNKKITIIETKKDNIVDEEEYIWHLNK